MTAIDNRPSNATRAREGRALRPIAELAAALAAGRTSSQALVDEALARIRDLDGEGGRAFIRVFETEARAQARASDETRAAGFVASPLSGVPVSVKDCCDVAGYTTLAGCKARADLTPAASDAAAVARLRKAGAIVVGTTQMPHFALSATGANPDYPAPLGPYDRATGRVPGGSSTGAAVSVADGMVAAALGTDTAGSVRIPAAFCGIVGFKPTARRVPLAGVLALAPSLDSVGILAGTVGCCALVDAALAAAARHDLEQVPLRGLRLAVPKEVVLDGLDREVGAAFSSALTRLSGAGAIITDVSFPALAGAAALVRAGTIALAEAFALHRRFLDEKGSLCDPEIVARIRRGASFGAADYLEQIRARAAITDEMNAAARAFDAIAMPTVPVAPPAVAELADGREPAARFHGLAIRNPAIVNMLDRCALTVPCHERGAAPAGLTLMAAHGEDRRLLAMGKAVEAVLREQVAPGAAA